MFNLPHIEEEILAKWKKEKTFEKSLAKESPKGDYVFYDGPPFVTGTPHYGTILGSVIKDVVGRYWTMQGYHVARRWGWDCHGLPIENMVEKQIGINSKKEIEAYGIEKFNNTCRDIVNQMSGEWKTVVERIGRWVEFDGAYRTMDNTYIESVWWAFKEMYNKGLVYEGKKVLLNCPRCETPIAKAEIAMDNSYQDVTEESVTVKFRILNSEFRIKEDLFLLAWTTTPWTLPGNVALAVGEDIVYCLVESEGTHYILAKDRLDILDGEYKIIEEIKGSELVGIQYEPLYEIDGIYNAGGKVHAVLPGGFVSTEEGTGIVHTAVVYGEDDYELGLKYDLPIIPLLDQKAIFQGNAPAFLHGIYFKDADELVREDLSNRRLVFKTEQTTHSYPHCYRCGSPLFYNAINSWFINIQKLKPRLLELNEKLNWHPGHIKHGRFKKSVETAPDWTISRNRYWASSIPVWKSDDGEVIKVIGSVAELQQYATTDVPDDADLHKDSVDAIELKDLETEKILKRIPEVFDCWVESASMPFAAQHYPFENKEWFEKNFPAQFIAEYTGQIRTWFYYMLVISAALFDRIPFEHIVVTGVLQAEDGTKMSKSKGNYTDPMKFFSQYGVDGMRLFMMASPLMNAADANFSTETIQEKIKSFITLFNVVSFFETFAGDTPYEPVTEQDLAHVLDVWITAQLNELTKEVTEKMDSYDITGASRIIEPFIADLSTWYVRRSRDRFKSSDEGVKMPAVKVLRRVLFHLSRLMAPFTPFIADHVYTEKLSGIGGSVHLTEWPQVNFEDLTNKTDVLEKMVLVRQIVEAGLAERTDKKIPVRQPLSELRVTSYELRLDDEYLSLIKDELNVKEVVIEQGEGEMKVELDATITEVLKLEGIKRDLVRQINNVRKKQGLTIQDRVKLAIETGSAEIKKAIEQYGEEILHDTLANEFADFSEKSGDTQEVKVNRETVKVSVTVNN